ncbi:hypothetical protein QEU98_09665 [Trueperella pyogenes]|uniref:hypothetical protein n=1 Tax=Trueperella pyogenes TaxID=1661 RepID=UPI003249379B
MALAGHFRNCKIFTGYLGCFPSKGAVKKCDFNAYAMREKCVYLRVYVTIGGFKGVGKTSRANIVLTLCR